MSGPYEWKLKDAGFSTRERKGEGQIFIHFGNQYIHNQEKTCKVELTGLLIHKNIKTVSSMTRSQDRAGACSVFLLFHGSTFTS